MNDIISYPKFRFMGSWLDYSNTLHNDSGRFLRAIVRYGLYEEEPDGLSPCALEFFNGIVRPELDRQHSRIKKGLRI